MATRTDKGRYLDLVLVVFAIAVFIFASPFQMLWASPGTPWYFSYLLWFGVIVLTALVQRLRGSHEL